MVMWILLLLPGSAGADNVLKVATLAPEGSTWMNLFHTFSKKVEERTAGRVKFKFYAGGVQGDEKDVLRKIRLGQLSGAAVTGIGLNSITPEARVLDIARTYQELDALRAQLQADIRKRFEEKGYVIGSWGDVGPVHIFSNRPVRTLDDLRALRLWLWSDDPISKALFAQLALHGVPMGVPEVLPGLSTGQIDSFFGSPLSTVALQWGSHIKYMSTLTLSQATGATVISKKVYDELQPGDRKILEEEANAMQSRVLAQVRADNDRALETLKKQGMQIVDVSAELERVLDEAEEKVARANAESVSKEFASKVEKLVEGHRRSAR